MKIIFKYLVTFCPADYQKLLNSFIPEMFITRKMAMRFKKYIMGKSMENKDEITDPKEWMEEQTAVFALQKDNLEGIFERPGKIFKRSATRLSNRL